MAEKYSKEWWEEKYPEATAWRIYLPPNGASKGNRIRYVEELPEGRVYDGEHADAIPLKRADLVKNETPEGDCTG